MTLSLAALAALMAYVLMQILMPLALSWAPVWKLVDHDDEDRRVHRGAVPRIGGLALVLSVLLVLAWWPSFCWHQAPFLGGLLILTALGVWDDRVGLRPLPKLLGQAAAALCCFGWSGIGIEAIPLPLTDLVYQPDPISGSILAMVLAVLVINAMNLIDGLDSLAGGLALVAGCGLVVIAFALDIRSMYFLISAFGGALLGFLVFNGHPARAFLGDAGSMTLGYCLSYVGLCLHAAGAGQPSLWILALLVAIPLCDLLWVAIGRLLRGVHPFQADRSHVHHGLLALGFGQPAAVLILIGQAGLLVAAALLLQAYPSDVQFLGLLCLAQFALGSLRYLTKAGCPEALVRLLRSSERRTRRERFGRLLRQTLQGGLVAVCALTAVILFLAAEPWWPLLLALLGLVMGGGLRYRLQGLAQVSWGCAVGILAVYAEPLLRTDALTSMLWLFRLLLASLFVLSIAVSYLERPLAGLRSVLVSAVALVCGALALVFDSVIPDYYLKASAVSILICFVVIQVLARESRAV